MKSPNAVMATANSMGQRITERRFTPHARIAAISESADILEKTSTDDTSSASGIVHCIVSGKHTRANLPTSSSGMPESMYPTICTIRPIVRTNDSTRNASRKDVKNDPKIYRWSVFIKCGGLYQIRPREATLDASPADAETAEGEACRLPPLRGPLQIPSSTFVVCFDSTTVEWICQGDFMLSIP